MDSLVAKYSRPAYAQNEPLEDDEYGQELMNPTAHLSLNFAMPPVAQVRQLRHKLYRSYMHIYMAAYHST
jgi:hypothetical protein